MKANETLVWVIYDICEDKARTKIAKTCKQKGLYRVQYSVFAGSINRSALDELVLQIEELMEESDKVYVFPMCEEDFRKSILLGKAFDRKLIKGELLELII
ncbi:MAG: CRISPR-associated endonuclease Cas2 [Thermodesulfobacteriota bacterium]|nr:CRISPR-associated endonuclease Cas2 [Thermodesulfobacteriota bacterium]